MRRVFERVSPWTLKAVGVLSPQSQHVLLTPFPRTELSLPVPIKRVPIVNVHFPSIPF